MSFFPLLRRTTTPGSVNPFLTVSSYDLTKDMNFLNLSIISIYMKCSGEKEINSFNIIKNDPGFEILERVFLSPQIYLLICSLTFNILTKTENM